MHYVHMLHDEKEDDRNHLAVNGLLNRPYEY